MAGENILKRFELGGQYMKLMQANGYSLIDLNLIEPFRQEDKDYQPSSLVFERDQRMYAVRSDWTRSLLNYSDTYFLEDRCFCYFGPVVRGTDSFYQAGVELYWPTDQDLLSSIRLHLDFIKARLEDTRGTRSNFEGNPDQGQKLHAFIVNQDRLIDLYIQKYNLDEKVRPLIYAKNLSQLRELLGPDQPLYKALSCRISDQYDLVQEEFADSPEMEQIRQLKDLAEGEEIKFMLDLSFRSPQAYYNALYFQVFLNYHTPLLSGGQYNEHAFGIAFNLEGGLL